MKRLFIVRHAKSSWDEPALNDFDRPLNKRGENDAPLMGKVLFEQGIKADLFLSSPAKRAITTARIIAELTGYKKPIEENDIIYGAGVQQMLSIVNQTDNAVGTLFVFGHNPTLTHFAEELSNANIGNLPTAGVVGIEFEFDNWELVSGNTGRCFYYDYPKNHN